MQSFSYHAPTKLVFGPDSLNQACTEIKALVPGASKAFIVTGRGPTRASEGFGRLLDLLKAGGMAWEVYAEVGHDPDYLQVEAAARALASSEADCVIAYGGGSPMDCAKAACLQAANVLALDPPYPGASFLDFVYGRLKPARPGLPLICVPTTAGTGSELSNAAVTIDSQVDKKLGLSSPYFFPALALVDPCLQVSMPPALTAATGMDALTHALEGFVSKRATPLSQAISGHSAGLILANLEAAWAQGSNLEARSAMALASSEVAMAFSQTGLGMVHGFAHPVGARGGVAHGLANAIILPYVSAACAEVSPEPYAALARSAGLGVQGLDAQEAASLLIRTIQDLGKAIGIPARLGETGLARESLPAVLADAQGYRNRASSPRAFTDAELESLLSSMF